MSSHSSWTASETLKYPERSADEGSGSSCSCTGSERKAPRVDEATPNWPIPQETSSEMPFGLAQQRTVVEMKTKLGGKYDDLIDPNLPVAEKKKQRR